MDLSVIADMDLRNEYVRRFHVDAGSELASSIIAADHLRSLVKDPLVEHFIVVYLDSRNRVIDSDISFAGTINRSAVYPREIVRKALDHGATALILGHNHPSGNDSFSVDDREITRRIKSACKVFEIALHDHLLLCSKDSGYQSMADAGMM